MTDPKNDPKEARLDDFPYRATMPTRWGDNDMLGHVNNVVYQRFYEVLVVRFLMQEAGLDWTANPHIPMLVEALCRFHRPAIVSRDGTGRAPGDGPGHQQRHLRAGALRRRRGGTGQHRPLGARFHRPVTEKPAPIPAAIRAVYEAHA